LFPSELDTNYASIYSTVDSAVYVGTGIKWAICVRANLKWAAEAAGQTSSGKSRHSGTEYEGKHRKYPAMHITVVQTPFVGCNTGG
jgi:hypothetical protein